MSVEQHGRPGRLGAAARDRCAVAEPAAPSVPAATQERVLADIRHELGNFFHKLYYWDDSLQEQRPRR